MKDDPRLQDAFDNCLTQLGTGESLADCLLLYPDLKAELRPMLEAVQAMRSASRVLRRAQARSREHFLAAAAQLRPPQSK